MVQETNATSGILTSLIDKDLVELGCHGSVNDTMFVLNCHLIGMVDKSSLTKLSNIEVGNVIKIGFYGQSNSSESER